MSQYTASCHQHAVMFADVSGSSALYKLVGNEKAKAIIDETIYFMVTLTAEHQGTVVKTIGDEIMARFDDCTQACAAASAIQHRCEKDPQLGGLPVRIGIAYGPTLLTEDDVFGDTVNDAACVTHIARAGQVVLTQSVVNNLQGELLAKCQMFDQINTKGDTGETTIFRLLWETSVHRERDRKSTRLNSSHVRISCAVFCLKKKKKKKNKNKNKKKKRHKKKEKKQKQKKN